MWIWIIISTSIIRVLLLIPGFRRVRSERVVGPEEGIEDNETAASYDRVSRMPPFKLLRMLVVRRLKKLHPRGILADIGCGPGYFTGDVARSFPDIDIVALDISEEMLLRAEKHLSIKSYGTKINYRQGDIHELPFDDGSLDFVVSTLSLHHWADPSAAFGEIRRVLKPRGQFLVFDTRRDSPLMVYHLLKFAQLTILPRQLKEKNEPTSSVMASYTPDEVREILETTSFTETAISPGFFWLFATGRKL
jgi:ubiquinone/menaquinone biosynthesis C-methylase UbiE